jgi:hypothetical protein
VKKVAQALAEDAPLVPVSQTHRVTTVSADVRSAYEQTLDKRQEDIKGLEDELLEEALTVIGGAMKFADIDPSLEAPDGAFLERFKDDPDPQKLFRLMKYGLMKMSEAPVGLQLAQKTAIGILKARAGAKGEIRPLAVNVQIVQSMPEFQKVYETDGE